MRMELIQPFITPRTRFSRSLCSPDKNRDLEMDQGRVSPARASLR